MPKYEYQIIHQLANRVEHLTRQLNSAVRDGWDPVSMTGDEHVYVLLRRPYQEESASAQSGQAAPPAE
ncbi:MAG: hypothetical protein GX358_03290 [candidate division WS1 bacterium]|jgi:hypothetical protein|nr:hypothetical protein [candidate division WS1 bacterium]